MYIALRKNASVSTLGSTKQYISLYPLQKEQYVNKFFSKI
jgi:hypothetical protein